MKIGLYLGVNFTSGGMYQYAHTVLEGLVALSENDPEIKIEVAYSKNSGWNETLTSLGLKGNPLEAQSIGEIMANALMAMLIPAGISKVITKNFNPLSKELISYGCDIWLFPAQEALAYQLPAPTISTIHDLMHRYQPNFPEVKSFFRYYIREHRFYNLCRNTHAVLTDSVIGRQHVIESYSGRPENIHVLPYITPSYIKAASPNIEFEKLYRLPRKYIFYPAQFWLHKNHLKLLDAVNIVKRKYDDIQLVLSGAKRNNFTLIKKYSDNLGLDTNVSFVGYVPNSDISEFYKNAVALVMPTYFGPTNIPPLEAMAMACPVLISNLYSMPDQCGDAGLYFDPDSAEDIAEKIMEIWGSDTLRMQLSDNAKKQSALYQQDNFNINLGQIMGIISANL